MPDTLDALDERAMGVDQTHESWVVGGQVVVKWMTEPLDGTPPGRARLRRLAAAGFAESPALWGLVEWREAGTGDWVPVAVAQSFLPGTEDGWSWAVTEARRALRLEPGRSHDFAGDLGERRRADAPGPGRGPAGPTRPLRSRASTPTRRSPPSTSPSG